MKVFEKDRTYIPNTGMTWIQDSGVGNSSCLVYTKISCLIVYRDFIVGTKQVSYFENKSFHTPLEKKKPAIKSHEPSTDWSGPKVLNFVMSQEKLPEVSGFGGKGG